MADGYLCRDCSRVVSATKNNRYRTHKDRDGQTNCVASSAEIPKDLLEQAPSSTRSAGVPEEGKDFAKCPQCGRNVKLTRLGYFPQHDTTLYGGEQCSTTGVRAFHASKTDDLPLPGDQIPEKGVNRALKPTVSNQLEVERERVGRPMKELTAAPEPPASTAPATVPSSAGAAAAVSVDASPSGSEEPPVMDAVDWSDVPEPAPDASSGASTETNSPESTSTSGVSQPPPVEDETPFSGPFRMGNWFSEKIRQPDSPLMQPPAWNGIPKPEPMDDLARDIAVRFKEIFYAYDNRKSSDNRSAQTTLGPSEIGTPCDRRLAMALLNVPPVNPGGDGWAAFVGTCGHAGVAEMLEWSNAGTGRWAVEMRLTFPSIHVPKGTTDAFDRRDGTAIDWKFMGDYSLKKFRLDGPSDTYRIQAQTYGLGLKLAGETVRNVAVAGLPRAAASLDDMHVWTEKFDPSVGREALKRVEKIAKEVEVYRKSFQISVSPPDVQPMAEMEAAKRFDTASDCRFCPFYLKGDKEMRRGCPGV